MKIYLFINHKLPLEQCFRDMDVYKGGFIFSKCSKCKYYKDLININIKGSERSETLKELKKSNNI